MKETVTLSGKDNPTIKFVAKLQNSSRFRRENGLFVLEGLRILSDAADNGVTFKKLFFSQGFREKNEAELDAFLRNSDESFEVSNVLFEKISDTKTPQGVLAVCEIPTTIYDLSGAKNGKFIGLENLNDPSNVGAICRSGEAFGVSGIIVSGDSCDLFSPKVLRASMGTVLRLPVFVAENFTEFLKATSLQKIACVVDKNAENISNVTFQNDCIVLIGNEGNGLTKEAVNLSDVKTTIPMAGRVESLNASVAAAVAMWEMMK